MDYKDSRIGFVLSGSKPAAPAESAGFFNDAPLPLPPHDAYRAVLAGRWSPQDFAAWVDRVRAMK